MSAVTACTWGAGSNETEELLTLARKLSSDGGGEFVWAVVGPADAAALQETAGKHGVTRIDRIESAALESYGADAYVEALAAYCEQREPSKLLFSQTFDARTVAPRLAGRTNTPVVMNALDLASGDEGRLLVTASAFGGDTRAVYRVAGDRAIVCVMANAVAAEPAGTATTPAIERVDVTPAGDERVRVVEAARTEGPRLEDAQVIVAGGRGLGDAANFALVQQLAEALGGMAAASRPIVDDGWTDAAKQIGLTGKIVRPALYIAAGISGASQHMAGCAAAKTIVAINRDPDAAIFRYARYGIVGDCVELLPELTKQVGR